MRIKLLNCLGYLGVPKRMGVVNRLRNFDADFFGISKKEADLMDPQVRKLLEVTYEAIFDAGKIHERVHTTVYIVTNYNE